MSFDIATTPTLEAVATQDEQRLAQDLQARVDEAVAEAQAQPEVIEAAGGQRAAEETLHRLRKAERALTQQSRESRDHWAVASQAAMEATIESAASGSKLDLRKLNELGAIEERNRFLTRAIERIVEHLIPLAHIAALREESHALLTQARAMERIAQERAEKVLGQLRDAVTEEVILPVDMSKGVAGALLAQAAGLKRCAVQLSDNADQMERSYRDR
jgi:hypothetical protein